jgi:hypothetical protein
LYGASGITDPAFPDLLFWNVQHFKSSRVPMQNRITESLADLRIKVRVKIEGAIEVFGSMAPISGGILQIHDRTRGKPSRSPQATSQ